jgi:hypothetical protein
MRKPICIEGKEFEFMRVLAMPGSIYIDDKDTKIPLTVGFDQTKLVGYATNLQRDVETGEVSMELTIHPSFDLDLEEFDARVTLTDVMEARGKDDEELRIINAGRLREISLIWEKKP